MTQRIANTPCTFCFKNKKVADKVADQDNRTRTYEMRFSKLYEEITKIKPHIEGKICEFDVRIEAYRSDSWQKILSEYLLPGD